MMRKKKLVNHNVRGLNLWPKMLNVSYPLWIELNTCTLVRAFQWAILK